MNRKNLTAAVLAGLAGAAGLAGTAQAVNLNPDGLGQVLIYPYYTANDGNQTLLSVVNTTDNAKAVKVRFLEGFNSREVLDFNLYLSHHDVWVAAIVHVDGASVDFEYETETHLIIPDDSCTVPYLYEDKQVEIDGVGPAGMQPFLNLAYTGKKDDTGPQTDDRVKEGHFEIIEMGTIKPGSATEKDITHTTHKGEDGTYWAPGDCDQLVDNWTNFATGSDGMWYDEAVNGCEDDDDSSERLTATGQACTDTLRNSGGLFGGAAVVNPDAGAMYSYDAKAVQGFDKTVDGLHYLPGTIHPSLNDGSEDDAWVFFGVPQNRAVNLQYDFPVDAVSAVFMHEHLMNEYTTADTPARAATEWIVTFPTKNFYVDPSILGNETSNNWRPQLSNGATGLPLASCNLWEPGDDYPRIDEDKSLLDPERVINVQCNNAYPTPTKDTRCGPFNTSGVDPDWEDCLYVAIPFNLDDKARAPFTELYGAEDCELVSLITWDRDERTFEETPEGRPPTVSPAPPIVPGEDVVFELCNEVNVLRFGERSVFGSLEDVDGDSLIVTVLDEFTDGWGRIDFGFDPLHEDTQGLVGLPVTGFAANRFENDFIEGDDGTVKAFYGATYWHKGNVKRSGSDYWDDDSSSGYCSRRQCR